MDVPSAQVQETILVLCHSFFHDAFRIQKPINLTKFKIWMASRFVANLIIEKQAELPEGSSFAVTSKQVFADFASKFHGDNPSDKQKETVAILHNSIYVIDRPSVERLSIDDSVLVITDTLYSRSNYAPILVSNIPKKIEKAEEFYRKKNPQAKIPYPIYSAIETEAYLRGRFTELCKLVDKRIENKLLKKT
jgi:hypothetical protein